MEPCRADSECGVYGERDAERAGSRLRAGGTTSTSPFSFLLTSPSNRLSYNVSVSAITAATAKSATPTTLGPSRFAVTELSLALAVEHLAHTVLLRKELRNRSKPGERKIDLIEQKLDRLGNLVEASSFQVSKLDSKPRDTERPPICTASSSQTPATKPITQLYLPKAGTYVNGPTEQEESLKGQSSLSAHSSFALDFLHNAVGTEQGNGADSEFRTLLDIISPIVDAFTTHPVRPLPLFPNARLEQRTEVQDSGMPPIQTAVALLRLAENDNNVDLEWTSQFFKKFLPSQSLSDLCLKIYFCEDYTPAEFIIIYVALYFLGSCISNANKFHGHLTKQDYEVLMSTCQMNLETALSNLSLFMDPSYEMLLALTLSAIYALDSSRNSLASVIVRAASHATRVLEYHSQNVGMDASGELNTKGLLFWIIYFLEKMLSLRTGRTSSIVDTEITLPLPQASPSLQFDFMDSIRSSIKVAGLAGRVYTELYSREALSLPAVV
ncbi:hypothetical protein BDW74DRAFT_174956 [Aspergillus multicolor]|uniref:fungal specific transcription factor domain-containing protein n=1 Tax=Aspergillus multicolor TaxID=41759 RepID=UPI003CCE37C2